jgi:hypothetical protein
MDNEHDVDVVSFTDDNGEELTLQVIDYFLYNGEEYVVLADHTGCDCDDEDCEDCCGHEHEHACCCGCADEADDEADEADEADDDDDEDDDENDQVDVYVMKVKVVDDDNEEFVPIEPEKEPEILEYASKFLNGELPDDAY